MKKLLSIAAVFAVFSAYNVYAAESVDLVEVHKDKLVKVGNTSEVQGSTPESAEEKIEKEADKAGADYYRITSLGTQGDGSKFRATAELYKKP